MKNITFSINSYKPKFRDLLATGKLAESFFITNQDKDQMQVTTSFGKYIAKNFPQADNVIKDKNKVIGFTFILPCLNKGMQEFISKEITENDLTKYVKESITKKRYESFYLCSAFLLPEYRNKGIISTALTEHIKYIERLNKNAKFFYWAYSKEGKKLVSKIERYIGKKMYYRK